MCTQHIHSRIQQQTRFGTTHAALGEPVLYLKSITNQRSKCILSGPEWRTAWENRRACKVCIYKRKLSTLRSRELFGRGRVWLMYVCVCWLTACMRTVWRGFHIVLFWLRLMDDCFERGWNKGAKRKIRHFTATWENIYHLHLTRNERKVFA